MLRGEILVDHGFNTPPNSRCIPHHGDSTATARNDYGSAAGQGINQGNVADVSRFRRWHHLTPAPPGIFFHCPAKLSLEAFCFFLAVKIPNRFGGPRKSGVAGVYFDLRDQPDRVSWISRIAQRVLESLHQKISGHALRICDTDVERHRGHPVTREHLTQNGLPDSRAIAVGDHEFPLELEDGQQCLGSLGRNRHLLLRRPFNAFGMNRIASDRDQQPRRQIRGAVCFCHHAILQCPRAQRRLSDRFRSPGSKSARSLTFVD